MDAILEAEIPSVVYHVVVEGLLECVVDWTLVLITAEVDTEVVDWLSRVEEGIVDCVLVVVLVANVVEPMETSGVEEDIVNIDTEL